MAYRKLSYSLVLIGLMLVAVLPSALFLNHVEASQPWWNTNWQYRKAVAITSAANLTNYDVLVTVDTQTLVAASKMKSDGSDIRFVDGSNVVLSYWIESPTINMTTTRIWVNATSISTSGTTVWMYYGNPSANALSSGTSTFSFFDDDWASISGQGYNPVQTATQSWWESTCSYPNVFYDTSFSGRGPYQMLYDGHNVIGNVKGYAYSPDLINWTEYNAGSPHPPNPNPILAPGYTGNSQCAWGDPIKVGSTYYLFYSVGPGTTYRAESTNLINWTNLTPLNASPSTIGTGAAILKQGDGITPILVNGKYWMVYFTAFAQGSMYLASSTDLLNWTPWSGNPLLSPTPGGFDSLGLWTPSFVMLNNIYYIYYEAQNSTYGYITGYAKANAYNAGNPITPDNATWTKSSDAVLKHGPTGSWDDTYCIDPIIRQFNGIYYLFYTGNSANGFATSTSPDGPWTKYNAPTTIWTKGGSPTVSGGIVTLGSGSSLVSTSTYLYSAIGYRANFVGSSLKNKWGGFIQGSANDRTMIGTNTTDSSNLYLRNYVTTDATARLSGVTLGNFHAFEVLWKNAKSTAVVDHGAVTSTLTTQVPTKALPVTFYNFNDATYTLQVDWVFVRPYNDPEPTTTVGNEETAPSYTLTITTVGQGSVSLNATGPYSYGAVVQLTAVPVVGWSFDHWTGDLTGSANPATLTITGNMSVTAAFTQNVYTLTVAVFPPGSGSVALNNTGPSYYYGDVVQLTAVPVVGWSFDHWSGDITGSANPANLVITGNKSVTATFIQSAYTLTVSPVGSGSVNLNNTGPYHYGDVVQLSAVPSVGWSFVGWSGDLSGSLSPTTITITGNMAVTATFSQNQYTLTVNVAGSGVVNLNNTGPYHYGDTVQLTAVPSVGWSFQSWSGDLTGSSNPAELTVTGNMAVTATFTQNQYTLSVTVVGGGSVGKNPDQGSYTWGTNVTLTATANVGWTFAGWTGDASGTVNPVIVNMTGNKAVTATFTQNLYTLTINTVGNGIVNLDNNGPYHYGDSVQLTAVPAAGWSFDQWSGDLTGSTNPAALTITRNMAVTANFVLPYLYVDPSSIQRGSGDTYTTFQTTIMVNKISDLKGFDFNLTWDNDLIALTNVDFNNTLDGVWGSGDWYLAYNLTGSGYYELAAVSTSTSFTSTVATPLATLTFIVKAAAGQTSIHFALVKLSDSQANSIQAEVTDGSYTMTGPQYLPVLQMNPGSVTCRKHGESFTVQVNVTNAITLDALNFTIYYSPTLVRYVSVSWGQLGSGTITSVDQTNGILEGYVAGTAISGNCWLLNVTFQDIATMIWKHGQLNELDGQVWLHYASLSFSGVQQLVYQEGGLGQISVNNVAFAFVPIQGDITNDGVVNILDLRTVATYFDVKQGDPLWSVASSYDLSGNGVIDIYDLVLIGANFGYTYP